MILRQDFDANFDPFPVVYNEVEHQCGKDLTENGYSATSILRQVLGMTGHLQQLQETCYTHPGWEVGRY
jgi:hypothetical protein